MLVPNQSSTEIADFSSDDELSKEVNCCLLFHVYYTRVAELLLPIVELQKPAQLGSEPLSCGMYGALNNVRTIPRASHRGTGKRRVNQVNEDSKLKSEVYRGAKAICIEGREALGPIGPRPAPRTRVPVEG